MRKPMVSVLMPVYNGEKYIKSALQGILEQSFRDFEFIIVNDGSTDATQEIINTYHDERIVVITNSSNLGIVASLNKGVSHCRGVYIARMDADDIASPIRLEKQIAFLQQHPDIDICGTEMLYVNECDVLGKIVRQKETHLGIKLSALFFCPLFHPTVMARKSVLQDNPYSDKFSHAEDYELWSRLLRKGTYHFANIDKPLLKYRVHTNSISSKQTIIQQDTSRHIRREELRRYVIEDDIESILDEYMPLSINNLFRLLRAYNNLAIAWNAKESTTLFQKIEAYHFCTLRLARHIIKISKPYITHA